MAGWLSAPISAPLRHPAPSLLPTCIEGPCALPWEASAQVAILCQPVVGFSEQVVHQGTGFGLGGQQGPVDLGPHIQKGQILPHSHQDLRRIVYQGEVSVTQRAGMQ